MPDCWLEVSTHPEGPATGQIHQVFSVFFLSPRANAELVPKFHAALHAPREALPLLTSTFRHPMSMLKFKITIECNKTLLNFLSLRRL
jgi:hypothetical protein